MGNLKLRFTNKQKYIHTHCYAKRTNIIRIKNNNQKLNNSYTSLPTQINAARLLRTNHQHQEEFMCTQIHTD